jgi:hypothetical protein
MAGILDWIVESAKNQYAKGAPYREAASGLLQGDMNKVNQGLSKSDLTPLDFAMMLGTINPVGKTSFELAHQVAQKNAALPISEGGLGLPVTNTAMDRANSMGYDTKAYTGANIEGEINSVLPKSWFSKEPEYSSKYSNVIPADGISKDPRVYPVLLRTGKTEVNPMFGLYEDMEKALSKKKTDTFKVEGVGGGSNDFYVTKNPNQVRSINAAFDPFRRNEPDILAGVAAAPVGLLAVDKEKTKKKRSNK